MKKVLLGTAAVAVMAMGLTSCSKYEDGPSVTLLTKKSRMANNWTLSSMTENGTAVDLSNTTMEVDMTKEGTYTQRYTISYDVLGQTVTVGDTTTGAWAFSDDKTQLLMTEEGETEADTMVITMLKKDQLDLRSTDGEDEMTLITRE